MIRPLGDNQTVDNDDVTVDDEDDDNDASSLRTCLSDYVRMFRGLSAVYRSI